MLNVTKPQISVKGLILFTLLIASINPIVKGQQSLNNFDANVTQDLIASNFINEIPLIYNNPSVSNLEDSKKIVSDPDEAEVIENISAMQFKYAMLMNVDVESLTNTDLYNFITEWYGTHYRMGGTTKKGIDCSAFTGTLMSSVFSLNLPRTAREQYNICEHINKEELMAGDLVFFNTRGGVSHVGVYLANNHFVHSCSSQGVMISSLDDTYYSKKYIGGGRVNQ